MFDQMLEDRSINSHIQAAFDAVERYGQTPEAFSELVKTMSGFERKGGKSCKDPYNSAQKMLSSDGRKTGKFEKLLLMRCAKVDERQ